MERKVLHWTSYLRSFVFTLAPSLAAPFPASTGLWRVSLLYSLFLYLHKQTFTTHGVLFFFASLLLCLASPSDMPDGQEEQGRGCPGVRGRGVGMAAKIWARSAPAFCARRLCSFSAPPPLRIGGRLFLVQIRSKTVSMAASYGA